MKQNVIWSVLSKGRPYGSPKFGRRVTPTAYDDDQSAGRAMLDVLVPFNDELLRAVYAEHILQLILGSQHADRALSLDPLNTYRKCTLQFPDPGDGLIAVDIDDSLEVYTQADDALIRASGQGQIVLECLLQPGVGSLQAGEEIYTFTITNGQTSKILLSPGLAVRFRGPCGGAAYEFLYTYTLPASLDWASVWESAQGVRPVWSTKDLRDTWDTDPRWEAKLAAFAMSAVELFVRA